MPIVPVRSLGRLGVIKDVPAWELPPDAWSSANNIRFDSGKVMRGPAHRLVENTLTSQDPHLIFPVYPDGTPEYLVICAKNGRMYKWVSGTETDYTPVGFVNTDSDIPFSACQIGDVVYVNRETDVPYALLPTGVAFIALTNWDSTYRAKVLRSYKDFLVALNVTKGATAYPKLVKTSDIGLQGAVPVSWDHTDTTKLATENPLLSADSELLDGLQLRDDFMIYTRNQVWRMRHTQGRLVFDYRKLFDDGGVINQNCVVEVEGKHFVFGPDDIYVHDGNTKSSIVKGRVHDYIYDALQMSSVQKFFVAHNPRLHEVLFHYQADDGEAEWVGTKGCNRVAVYNYRNDTWAFRDVPAVTSAAFLAANSGILWSDLQTAGTTWDQMGGSWASLNDGEDFRHMLYSAVQDTTFGFTTSKLLGVDMIENGSTLNFPLDTASAVEAYVERTDIDMDQMLGEQIRSYKVARALYPQLRTFGDSSTVNVRTGAKLVSAGNTEYDTTRSFNPRTAYKVDFKKGGRYLAIRYTKTDQKDFELTGHDLDVSVTGRR
jgi:hypothetical protein